MPKVMKKHIDLDNIPDTSGTEAERESTTSGNDYGEYVKVPPPFKGNESNKPITWSDLSYTYKLVAVISAIFLAVVVPSVWFASKIDTKVDGIENDVREIKQSTKSLTTTSIKNTSKIENMERSLSQLSSAAVRRPNIGNFLPMAKRQNRQTAKKAEQIN